MHEMMISKIQKQSEEEGESQKGNFVDEDNMIGNKENMVMNGAALSKAVFGDNTGKNLVQSFSFYNTKPGETMQFGDSQPKFQSAYPETPKDSPVKFKISDTPLLKSLNSSGFIVDTEDNMFDETGNLRDQNKKVSENNNKSFGLDSSFMRDLFVRSNAQNQGKSDEANVMVKEVQIAVVEEKPFEELLKEKKKELPANLPQAAVEDKSAKRLSFSIKNIIDSKIPDTNSYLPQEGQDKISAAIASISNAMNPESAGEENIDLKEKIQSKNSLIARLFSQEDDGAKNKEKELPNIDFTQEIDDEIKKSRRLSSAVHGILVENPPSTIKKIEQSNFSLEQDDFMDNLMRDKHLYNMFQEKENAQPLTTSMLLNQSFEEKLNKYMSPQKKGSINPNLQLSKSPLLSSPQYEIQSQKVVQSKPIEKEDDSDKRRLSLKMKLSDSQSFIDGMEDDDWKEVTTPKAEVKPVAMELDVKSRNEENQSQKQLLKFPYSTDLKPISECSESLGESDAKKSISSGPSVDSGVQEPHILLQDPARRISLKVSIADEDDESFRDDDDMPFIFEPEKKKVVGVNAKKVVDTVPPVVDAAIVNEIKQSIQQAKEVENKSRSSTTAMQIEGSRVPETNKTQAAVSSSPGGQGKKSRSPYLKRKNRPSTEPSESEDPKLKKTKLSFAGETKNNSGQKIQVELKKSPFKLKGVLKNSKRSEAPKPVQEDKETEEMRNNQKSTKEVTINNAKEAEKKQEEAKETEDISKETKINSLIVKSPRINKLQKKFLIDFLSPRDSLSVNQSTDVNNAYALLERAPIFNQDQALDANFMRHTDDNKFNNSLKNAILLKCKSCYEYAQKVKLLKEQLHDLEYNIDMLDNEIKSSEAELERKTDEVDTSGSANMFDEYGVALNYDKTQFALVENLQTTLALFGFTVKTSISNEKGVRYRIKFDNDIMGIAAFELREGNGQEPEYYLNEFTLIDLQSNYRKSSRNAKILLGEELLYNRDENKTEPTTAFSRKTIVDIVFNEVLKSFFRKKMAKVSSVFVYVSFRLRGYFYFLNTLKYLATSQILEKAIINYDSLVLKTSFKFRYLPRSIIFSLNLRKSWWNDFEVLWEGDEKFSNLGDAPQDENKQMKSLKQEEKDWENRMWNSAKTKLMTLFNSEINKRTINKFENLVGDVLSFRWATTA